jgi:hypothetical protein
MNDTATQRLMLDEIEKHTIHIDAKDSDRQLLEKVAINLNGKTEAIAKIRRSQTAVMTQLAKLQPLVDDHDARFKRFDQLCHAVLERLDSIWIEIKDNTYQGFKKACIIFICVVILYFCLYPLWNRLFPLAPLPRQTITPSPSS